MGFIIPTERRHWKTKLLYVVLYVVVVIGALTMIYPFLIMISGSLKCRTDFEDFEVIPSYLTDDALLYRKFIRARYNANIWRHQFSTQGEVEAFEDLPYPESVNERALADLTAFIESRTYPRDFISLGQMVETGVQPRMQRRFRQFVYEKFDGDIVRMNDALGLALKGWDAVVVPEANMLSRSNQLIGSAYERLYRKEFRPRVARREFWPIHVEGLFATAMRNKYRRQISAFNEKYGTNHKRFGDIPFPRTRPVGAPHAKEWDEYVQRSINLIFLRLKPGAAPAFRESLRARYHSIAELNGAWATTYVSFDEASMPLSWPGPTPIGRDWQGLIEGGHALDAVEIDSFENRYRDWLRRKYGSLEKLNAVHGARYASFAAVPLRLAEYDAWLLREHRKEILWEFATRNYRHAADYLLLRGRAFWVTFLYCALNVLGHLIVNPLAAYALSRYRLRCAHWVLLFCLLTMAFPAEVVSIPRFLLIRELGLLNTIWALVLPGLAHGFSIFILKGFFDGLPKELYEAALIEGAPERWMFKHITLSLTKPILAVTAFGSFMSAYGAFMFALIICPEERMWTISVWLYQFQQNVTEPVAFAGLVMASLPVLAALLLAQRFIMRGIVLPVEK